MRVDELRAELDQAAGPEQPPSDAFVADFLNRQATLRSRRRWGVSGVVGALAIALVAGALVLQPGPSRRSVDTPAGPSATTPTTLVPRSDVPVARLELASPILTAGTTVSATVVVENDTGQPVTVVGCGSPFQPIVGNDEYEQTIIWTSCYQTFTLVPGETRFPVSILVGYTECNWNGSRPGAVPCPPIGPGSPDFAPFPDGAYRLTIESTAGDQVQLSPPMTVQVTTSPCATDGETVRVPDVRGDTVADAVAKLGRKRLVVVPVPAERKPRTGHAIKVVAQQPTAGSTVPRNSCVVMRTR